MLRFILTAPGYLPLTGSNFGWRLTVRLPFGLQRKTSKLRNRKIFQACSHNHNTNKTLNPTTHPPTIRDGSLMKFGGDAWQEITFVPLHPEKGK